MNELHKSILCYALTRYLIQLDITPYDAMVENSKPSNNAEEWVPYILEILSGSSDFFKVEEVLHSDPVKHRVSFQQQLAQLQDRTVLVSSIAGMLCQRWICENTLPYSDNKFLYSSEQFIDKTLLDFV